MNRWKNLALACGAVLALTTAACGDSDGDRGETDPLVEMLNESRRLEAEAIALEYRVIERCLEDRGHTVHRPSELRSWEPAEMTALANENPHARAIPDAETAAEWGFGQWVNTEGADPDAWKEYEEEAVSDTPEDEWAEADDSEFEALSAEEQYSWYVDFLGRDAAQWQWGDHFGFEAPDENTEGDGGELVFDQNVSEEPPPGGCRLEMIEALYGEPQLVEFEGGGADAADAYETWAWRPAVPLSDVTALSDVASAIEQTQIALGVELRDQIATEEQDFLDCVAERGHGNWTFYEEGGLGVADYWIGIYYGDQDMESDSGPLPDPPADLPSDFESLKALEIAMAVDFAECADDSGLREAAETTWAQVNQDYYASVETQMYAWQEEMREVIAEAQDLLDA